MTRTSKLMACTMLALLFTPGLQAAEKQTKTSLFNYNYIQIGYVDMDNNLDGIAVDGSIDISPEIALIASYLTADENNLDYDRFSIGASYHGRLDQINNADMALHLEYVDATTKVGPNENDDSGVRVGSTLRYRVQTNLEMFGDISFTNVYENDLALTQGVVLTFNNNLSAVVSYELSENDTLFLGVRFPLK